MARPKIPEVRILTAPEALAQARAAGEAYAINNPPPAVSLKWLGRSKLSFGAIEEFARAGEPLVQELREIAGTSGSPAGAACVCLMRLGYLDASARLSELLAGESSLALGEFLTWIGLNDHVVRVLPDLEPLRRFSVEIALAPDHPDRLPALRAAFAVGATLATTEIVDTLVAAASAAKSTEFWIHGALQQILRSGGDSGLAAARALLQSPFIEWATNAREVSRLRDPRIVPDIERALSADPKKAVRGALLEALADFHGAEAVPRLLEALDDPELAASAAAALGRAKEGTGDEAIVVSLVMSGAGAGASGEHSKAVTRIGGPLAMRSLAGLFKRGTRFDMMSCLWRVKGITTSSALRRFVDAEVIPAMPSDAELRAVMETGWAAHHDVKVFWHFLQASGRWVDAVGEDSGATETARHPILIERLAAVTGGKLPIEHVSQVDGPKDARDEREVEIQLVCGDRVYQVTIRTLGRNFDFVAVRTLLNEALRDRGQPERFTRVQQMDCETLIFGPQAAVEAACDEICLAYGSGLSEYVAWLDEQKARLKEAGGTVETVTRDPADIAFHIFRPTRAGAFPHDAVSAAVASALGSAAAVEVRVGAGWTEMEVHITRDQFTTAGADAIESLFVSVCDTAEAHFGRTLAGSDWARIRDGELSGAIDAIDWLQYFGPKFGTWLRGRAPELSARQSPRGAQVVKLDIDPLAPLWRPRQLAAKRISMKLRPFPPSAQEELDPEARLKRVSPPEPATWKPEERQAMLRARAGTLQAIEKGIANGRLFDRFRRRYLAEELDSARLDRIATWLSHYGAPPATAAFRAVARLHDTHPAAAPIDDIALEGCVKLVAWGGEDLPLLERELLVEHVVDLKDPGVAIMARSFPDRDAVAGLVKMTAMQVAMCQCPRCTETRKILGREKGGLT